MNEQRAGLLKTLVFSLFSWLITFYYCGKVIVVTLTNKQPRAKVDKVIRQWSLALVKVIGLNINVKGTLDSVPGRPCIIMCSHSSAYDIPVSFVALPGSIRMLAKKELFRIPLFGRAMRMSEFVSIDRQDKERARQDLALAKSKMESGITVWIAPEGTRSKDGNLLPFKKGGMHLAIQTGAIVIPVVIKDINRVLPVSHFRMNFNQTVEVRVGAAIDAAKYTIEERNILSDKVRSEMENMLAQPLAHSAEHNNE